MFDLDLHLARISDWLIPDLRNQRILGRRANERALEGDLASILIEKDADRGAEYRLGGRLHVVAGVCRPGLGAAFGAGGVRLADEMALVNNDQGSAVARRDDALVMVLDRLAQP